MYENFGMESSKKDFCDESVLQFEDAILHNLLILLELFLLFTKLCECLSLQF